MYNRFHWTLLGLLGASLGCERRSLEAEPTTAAPSAVGTPAPAGPVGPTPEVVDLPPVDQSSHVPVGEGKVLEPELSELIVRTRMAGGAYALLLTLCDDIGHRLGGSPALAQAVDWSVGVLGEVPGLKVWTQPVLVPHWERGEERGFVLAPRAMPLEILALGGSPGTPGLEAEVILAEDPDALGPEALGKIVLFDKAMRGPAEGEGTYSGGEAYGEAVGIRGGGPAAAARQGAVAALVRSVTARSLFTAHTGGTWYDENGPRIPAAAIPPEQASWIRRLIERGVPVRVRLEMGARLLPDAPSHNVIAELRGSELPDEVVLLGGHLDSWDVGQGAQDDGAGVVQSMEALRQLAALGKPLRRTVRVVLFTNEENGLRGGREYAKVYGGERHVAAIESDIGSGWPVYWTADGSPEQMSWLETAAAPLGMPVRAGHGGADIGPLEPAGVLVIGFRPDDRAYFDVHHTWADTIDHVDAGALQEGAAAMAGLAYLLANAPAAPPAVPDPVEKPAE